MTATRPLLAHVSVGVADIDRAIRFYDAALAALGFHRLDDETNAEGRHVTWGQPGVRAGYFIVTRPTDLDRRVVPGTGSHLCFLADDKDQVDAFHAAALAHGGRDNGAPGLRARYAPDYYAAYVHDPEGHALEAVARVRPQDPVAGDAR